MATYHAEVARLLRDHGVEVVYGLMGDANLFVVDHWTRELGGRYVAATHEANAVMMAAGHARTTGQVGVATVTHGPGLTNTLTALVECAKSSIPVLLVAGRTSDRRRHAPQKVEQRPLVEATGAAFERAHSAASLATDLAVALRRATVERRPVVLELPVDLMWEDVDPPPVAATTRSVAPPAAPDPAAVDTALGIVLSAHRSVVLAGQGALEAREPLVRLADLLGAALATTAQARDLFAGEPADLGLFGSLSTAAAQDVVADADCLLVFGASLTAETSAYGDLLRGKRLVQVDADPSAIGRTASPDAAIVADAGAAAEELVRWVEEAAVEPSGFARRAAERLARPLRRDPGEPRAGTVDLIEALERLDDVLPTARSVVIDVGRFALHALRHFSGPDARSSMWSGAGFASIGLGTGMAVGAAVARPDRPTVLVVGDGGLVLGGLGELSTAVELGLDLVIVVANDGSYGAEHVQFTGRGMDPGLSLLSWPDFAAVAEALGCAAATVGTSEELAALGALVDRRSGPVLIDLRLDPDRVTCWG